MIGFERRTLDNGLRVIIHEDDSTPMAVVNVLYDVGSSDEDPERTGAAHLLEHLMFGGSVNVPSYDRVVQEAGGENNAFTSNDITNYYLHLPAAGLETGLWLESDRMLDLRFSQKGLDIQKHVVIEEFKQRYLNQPYGDIWMLLRPLAYRIHPYKWPTIGMDISHIEKITLDEIRQFYYEHYCPSNAILCITGNVKPDQCFGMVDKWFGPLVQRKKTRRQLPAEPPGSNPRHLDVSRDVPAHEIIMAYKMCERTSPLYHVHDLISDLLAGGKSSRLFRRLVMEKKLFLNVNAYITGDRDPGLFIVRGRPAEGTGIDRAREELLSEILDLAVNPPEVEELNKVKNKLEATRQYAHCDILHKAMDLAYQELLGDAAGVNSELALYRRIKPEDIRAAASSLFDPANSTTLFYRSSQAQKKM
jgi:zinc protease